MRNTKSIILAVLLVLFVSATYAQKTSEIVVLLQGKTLNSQGQPVSVKITFTDKETNKKIRTNSNRNGGLYQVVLKPGHEYNVSFKGYLSVDSVTVVKVPAVNKYYEMSQTFTIKKIEQGLKLCEFNAFKPKDTVLTGNYKEYFSRMKQFLKENINASVVITISMKDSYFKKKRVRIRYKDKGEEKGLNAFGLKQKSNCKKF